MVIGVPVKSLDPECNGEVVGRVSDIIHVGCRSLTGQGVGVRCGDLGYDIEFFGIRLGAVEFTDKHVAVVADVGTDVVEERVANQSPKGPEGRPTHPPGITLPDSVSQAVHPPDVSRRRKRLTWMRPLRDMRGLLEPWRGHEPKLGRC